jgi:preprotein translocase subunit SecE
MADAGSKATEVAKSGGGFLSWIPKMPGFLREVRIETRKISWPTRKETITTAIMVAIMSTVMALFFLGIDQVFGWIVRSLISLAG